MNEQMIAELIEMLKSERGLHKDAPFLSDFENGCNEGANDILDNVERILSKYVDIPKHEIEQLSKEPKNIWGRMVFSNNNYTDSQYVQFIQELSNFDTKDQIEVRKNDTSQWDEFQDSGSYWIDALFSEKEANHLMMRFKGSFLLLEETLNNEGDREEIDREWIRAYEEEQKAVYGERPTAYQLVFAWKQNKEYFLANKGKPFGVVKVDN
ncbi:hypothetical protein CVD28_00955 [Bacillus sp. M6-12]|uniref:hypothetical protein n=1 Tax=Bacillus sp. M6-12 TaxID=2054166 RepID=UPI000C75C19B|nr:hypothetical protein [Bacillus sp. M6-12]PLS19002.1 hypothetical protein CVD28_00955 [Bacillus sp. M6-12]